MAKLGRPPKRTLTVAERESINETIREKENIVKATDNYQEGTLTAVAPQETPLNKEKLVQDIKTLRRVLDEESPEKVKSSDKDRLAKRRDELKQFLRDSVLETRAEINVTNNQDPTWISAMKKAQMRPGYEHVIAEYRELCKRLDPDDPMAGSLDAIRKDR